MLDCPSPSKAFLSACVSANSSPKMFCPGSWQHAMNLFCTHSAEMRCRSWEFSRVTLVCAAPLYLSRHFFGAQPDCLADTRLLILFFCGVFFSPKPSVRRFISAAGPSLMSQLHIYIYECRFQTSNHILNTYSGCDADL